MFRTKLRENQMMKNKAFVIFNIIAILIFAFFVIQMIRPNKVYHFGVAGTFSSEGGAAEFTLYQNIHLKPGMYIATIQSTTDVDSCGLVMPVDSCVHPRALMANYDVIYLNKEMNQVVFWLLESTDTLSFSLKLNGKATVTVGSMKLAETSGLWTMFSTILFAIVFIVDGLSLLRGYEAEHPIDPAKKTAFFGIIVITFLASIPFLMDGIILGADMEYHLHRMEALFVDIQHGVIPTRIAPRWIFELGYADPIFYCGLLLVFPAILRVLGFPMFISYQIFAIAVNLLTAWIAYFCYKKIFKDYRIGLFCSALHTLSVYRIYKYVVTGALGEGMAQIFIPLILLGLYETLGCPKDRDPDKKAWIYLMFGFAGIVQSHVLSTEITAFVTIVLCLICIKNVFRPQVFRQLFQGALSAFLLSLWYLVPFADYYLTQDVHIKHVSARTIQLLGLYPGELMYLFFKIPPQGQNFDEGMAGKWPSGSNFFLFWGLILFLALWFGNHIRKKDQATVFAKKSACVAAMLLLFTQQFFPWDKLQSLSGIGASLISSLQFPNRFLGWATCFMIFVMGYLFSCAMEHYKTIGTFAVIGVTLLSTLSSLYLINAADLRAIRSKVYTEESIGMGYISGGEYVIEGTDNSIQTYEIPRPSAGVQVVSYAKDGLKITAHCINEAAGQGYVDLPLLMYKGYQAKSRTTGEKLSLDYGENKVIRVSLPEGYDDTVELRFVSPFYWRIAELISLLSLAIFLVRYSLSSKGRKNESEK